MAKLGAVTAAGLQYGKFVTASFDGQLLDRSNGRRAPDGREGGAARPVRGRLRPAAFGAGGREGRRARGRAARLPASAARRTVTAVVAGPDGVSHPHRRRRARPRDVPLRVHRPRPARAPGTGTSRRPTTRTGSRPPTRPSSTTPRSVTSSVPEDGVGGHGAAGRASRSRGRLSVTLAITAPNGTLVVVAPRRPARRRHAVAHLGRHDDRRARRRRRARTSRPSPRRARSAPSSFHASFRLAAVGSRRVTSFVAHHGLLAVFVLMAIDAVFPAASELVMLYGGALASGALVEVSSTCSARRRRPQGLPRGCRSRGVVGYLVGAIGGWAIGLLRRPAVPRAPRPLVPSRPGRARAGGEVVRALGGRGGAARPRDAGRPLVRLDPRRVSSRCRFGATLS